MSANELHAWIEKHLARVDTNTDHIAELIVAIADLRTGLAENTRLLADTAKALRIHLDTRPIDAHRN